MGQSTVWTYDMYKKILETYPFKGKSLAKELGVSPSALEDRAVRMRVKSECSFTAEEIELIKQHGRKLGGAMMFLMPEHTEAEILSVLCDAVYG